MKKVFFIVVAVAVIMIMVSCGESREGYSVRPYNYDNRTAAEYNVDRAMELVRLDSMLLVIAFTEGVEGVGHPYFAGSRWTTAYGVTVRPDGRPIKRGEYIPLDSAKVWAGYHLRERVVPFFKFFDQRRLSDAQIYAVADLIYNIGGERFTGMNLSGKQIYESSQCFEAVRSGASDEECIALMTRFRRAGGKLATGLLKRRWIEASLYTGALTPTTIMDLQPTKFYNKSVSDFYVVDAKSRPIMHQGNYQLRLDDGTVSDFLMEQKPVNGMGVTTREFI